MDCQAITLGEHLLDVRYNLALQHNKVINLKLAVASIDGVIIGPQEYFSFCRLVGRPTRQRGYVEGMELSLGEARRGIGGGICHSALVQ